MSALKTWENGYRIVRAIIRDTGAAPYVSSVWEGGDIRVQCRYDSKVVKKLKTNPKWRFGLDDSGFLEFDRGNISLVFT
jgi:hypothetical protein